ncbi:MAG: replicative DNA helicase [Minisyncoccales bacterium]
MEKNQFEKLPPQSLEAEKSVLGSILLDKEAIFKIADFLKPDDFYKQSNQEIFAACLELFEKGEPIDILSVSNRLREKNILDKIGGIAYLTELANFVPTPHHIVNYARIVQKKRILRDLIFVSQEITALGYEEKEDIEKTLDEAEKKIFSVAQKNFSQLLRPVKDSLGETIERIEKLARKEKSVRGIPSGFPSLDRLLAGFQRSDLIILAARPGIGKSALALNIALNCALSEKMPVAFFSLEMSNDQIIDRLISSITGIDLWKLRTGYIQINNENNEEEQKIKEALEILSDLPLYICDEGSVNILQIKSMCRRLQSEHNLGMVILDYLQLLTPLNPNASPVQQVSENSRALKLMAKELNAPVLVISQLSRAVEQRTPPIPRLADLRMSGTIEQDSDVVLFIYREDKYIEESERKNIANIIISKHRNGPVGRIELYFDENIVSFRELERKHFEDPFQEI